MVELGVWNAQVAGSNPASQTLGTYLQLVEHLFEEQGVVGSIPSFTTKMGSLSGGSSYSRKLEVGEKM